MTFKLSFEKTPSPDDIQTLGDGIMAYAKQKKDLPPLDFFAFFIRDQENTILAGCNGCILYGCLYIDQLWVSEPLRQQGLGAQLVEVALNYGKEQGCTFATVNTFDWEARGFYQKMGFKLEFERRGFDKSSIFYFLRQDFIETRIVPFTQDYIPNLPDLITRMEKMYGLSQLQPMSSISSHYLLSGFQKSQPIILKLSQDAKGLQQESAALEAFFGFGVVKVFAEEDGMLLLERAMPGLSLKSYFPKQDYAAIQITCDCIKQLHNAPIPKHHLLPHIKDWLKTLDDNLDIPLPILSKARLIRDELLKTSSNDVLLHGDLHHDNILRQGDGWIVIDPKGVIGEPTYEVAAFIRNPMPELLTEHNALDIIEQRIADFSSILELPEQRVLQWCFVQAVLSWVWALEDGCDTNYFKRLTLLLEGTLG